MPTAQRSRMIAAPVEELWEVVKDPHHLPRWWPRVTRVEDVQGRAFTEVMRTSKGKVVRADFELVEADERARSLKWEQRVQGTPFGRVLQSSQTIVRLASIPAGEPPRKPARGAPVGNSPATEATEVTIELRQALNGFVPRFGGYMVRRAAAATLDEALDGLERISA